MSIDLILEPLHERNQSVSCHDRDEGVTELQSIEAMKLAAKHKCRWPERACQSQRPLRMCVRVAQGGVVDGGGKYLRSVAQTGLGCLCSSDAAIDRTACKSRTCR
jgi:hypothetical protein